MSLLGFREIRDCMEEYHSTPRHLTNHQQTLPFVCNSPMKPFVTSITANHESSIVRLSTHGTIVLFRVSLEHEHQEYHCVIVITQSRVVRKGVNVNLGLKVHLGLNCSCRRTCARATVLLGFISM